MYIVGQLLDPAFVVTPHDPMIYHVTEFLTLMPPSGDSNIERTSDFWIYGTAVERTII